jgi:hypothetical protein
VRASENEKSLDYNSKASRVSKAQRNETGRKTKSGVPSVELAAVPGIERKEKANGYYEILQGRAFGGDGINERFWLARAAAQLLCKERFERCSAEVIVASVWVLVADQSAVEWYVQTHKVQRP